MPSYTPPFGAGDALSAQTLYGLKFVKDWADSNSIPGSRIIITEAGIPSSSFGGTDPIPGSGTGAKFDPLWENVFQQFYEACNQWGFAVTAWAGASNWRVDLRGYMNPEGYATPLTYRTTASSVIENNLTGMTVNGNTITAMRGVNMAGGEFSDQGPGGVLNKSHTEEPMAGYYYPLPVDIQMLYGRGIRLVRIPVRWERLQPTLKQALDTTEMAKLKVSIDAAATYGMKVLLDMHNYARYDTVATGAGGGVYNLGQNAPSTHNGQTVGGTMNDCYGDVWTRIAQYFNGNNGIWGYDIMNEPHDLSGGANDWKVASRVAVEAIRAVNTGVKIAVEGYQYASANDWTNINGTAWQTQTIPTGQPSAGSARNADPNLFYNAHLYFDPKTNGFDGGYQDTYAAELSNATSAGFSPWSTGGYTAPATNNTLQSGFRKVFSSDFSDLGAFSGTYDGINAGSNTITLPYTTLGNPGSSMQVIATATSDEGAIRKSITASVARQVSFDFYIPTSATISTTQNFTNLHAWRDNNTTDLVETRVIGSGSGYNVGLTLPSGAYTFVNSGATILQKGQWNTIQVTTTDTDIKLYLNGSTTAEATITGSYAGVNFGGFAFGKFYGSSFTGPMYYDNASAGNNASYYAPPNGGKLATTTVSAAKGLMVFF